MKKNVHLVFLVFLSSHTYCQFTNQLVPVSPNLSISKANPSLKKGEHKHDMEKAGGDLLFSETFTGNVGAFTTSGTHGTIWKQDLDGPNGSHSSTAEKITSPTSSTGFMIFDADFHNGNLETNLVGNLESPIIDLSSVQGAVLSFYSRYRSCCSNEFYPKIEVSTDNFSTSMEFDVSIDGVKTNEVSESQLMKVNLSEYLSTASNKNNFRFKFIWTEASHYFWQIDDVSIVEAFDIDIELQKFWLADILSEYEQTDIPSSLAGLLTVQGVIKNNGSTPIPASTKINVTVFNSTTGAQIVTETGGTLSHSLEKITDTITFVTGIDLSTYAVQNYSVRADLITTEVDHNLTNDSLRRTFNITDYYYGQENFEKATFIESIGKLGNVQNISNSLAMVVGNIMAIPDHISTIDLHGLEVTIGRTNSFPVTINTEIEIRLYELNPNAATAEALFGDPIQSRFFTITDQMIPANNTLIDVLFNFHELENGKKMTLQGGKSYLIGISHLGGNAHFAYGLNRTDDDNSSMVFGAFSNFDNTEHWYTNNNQILNRMCFDPALIDAGAEELERNGLTFGGIYPNPATNHAQLNYHLKKETQVSLRVRDLSGKVVAEYYEGSKNRGNHKLDIDTGSFSSGVFFVTVSTNDVSITKTLIKK
jgi:hypothetical protein